VGNPGELSGMGGKLPPGGADVFIVPSLCNWELACVDEAVATAMGTEAPIAEIPPAAPAAPPAPDMPTSTVSQPIAATSGGPTQVRVSVTRDCGIMPTSTVGDPRMNGPPTCGTGPVVIGHTCKSPIRDAGIMPINTCGNPTVTTPPCAVWLVMVHAGIPIAR